MKIAYVCADHGIAIHGDKGAAIHIQELINAFADLGHEVRVVAARVGETCSPFPAEVEKVRVHPAPLAPAALETDNPARLTKERRYIAISEAVESHLIALHQHWPFDMIYERYSLWSAAGVGAARRLGVPAIVEVNAPLIVEQRNFRKLVLEDEALAIEQSVFTGASSIVAVSREVGEYAIAQGASPSRVHILANGVDSSRFNPAVEPFPLKEAGDAPVIGFVGSLKAWHGVDTLLAAFRQIRAEVPQAHLLIVGDGPMRPWIEGFVAGAELGGAVTVTGWVHHADMPGLIRRMDVATAPYPQTAGFYFSPLKLFEYLAVGRPIVASAIGQVARLIDDEHNGLLARPGDPTDLAEKVLRLHADALLADRLGQNAARDAKTHTWQKNALAVVDLAAAVRAAA